MIHDNTMPLCTVYRLKRLPYSKPTILALHDPLSNPAILASQHLERRPSLINLRELYKPMCVAPTYSIHLFEVRRIALYEQAYDKTEETEDRAEDFNDEDLDESKLNVVRKTCLVASVRGMHTDLDQQHLPVRRCCR